MGGDRRSAVIEAPADWRFAHLSEALDLSLEEYRSGLGERAVCGLALAWSGGSLIAIGSALKIPRTQPSRIGRTYPKPELAGAEPCSDVGPRVR